MFQVSTNVVHDVGSFGLTVSDSADHEKRTEHPEQPFALHKSSGSVTALGFTYLR